VEVPAGAGFVQSVYPRPTGVNVANNYTTGSKA
jgi:hypothetical protein